MKKNKISKYFLWALSVAAICLTPTVLSAGYTGHRHGYESLTITNNSDKTLYFNFQLVKSYNPTEWINGGWNKSDGSYYVSVPGKSTRYFNSEDAKGRNMRVGALNRYMWISNGNLQSGNNASRHFILHFEIGGQMDNDDDESHDFVKSYGDGGDSYKTGTMRKGEFYDVTVTKDAGADKMTVVVDYSYSAPPPPGQAPAPDDYSTPDPGSAGGGYGDGSDDDASDDDWGW